MRASPSLVAQSEPQSTAIGEGVVKPCVGEDTAAGGLELRACTTPKTLVAEAERRGMTAAEVAAVMYERRDTFCPQLLGACLGHHHEFCKSLAAEFPRHFHEFQGRDVLAALRAYTFTFRLPGESAQIERVLEGFAAAFVRENAPRTSINDEHKSHDLSAVGWFVQQPLLDNGQPCCISCGLLDDLRPCQGCQLIHFCRACARLRAGKAGHAIGRCLGYGRACVAASKAAGQHVLTYFDVGSKRDVTRALPDDSESVRWSRSSPCMSEDAVMVLSYAIIMLTTNLHNPKVKQKMTVGEFISQNRGVNAGGNFPGDYLAAIYRDVRERELSVVER